jgi:hypothetical protein
VTASVDGFAARQRFTASVNSDHLQRSAFLWPRHLDCRPLVATVQILAEGNLQLFVQAQICPSANSRVSQRARSQPVERELLPLLEEQASWQDTGQRFPLPPPERCFGRPRNSSGEERTAAHRDFFQHLGVDDRSAVAEKAHVEEIHEPENKNEFPTVKNTS